MKMTMKKMFSMLLALVMMASLLVPTAFATEGEDPAAQAEEPAAAEAKASFTSDDPDDNDMISLADTKVFTAKIPLDVAIAEEDLANVAWTMDWNKDLTDELYLDVAQYPNHTVGGDLSGWKTSKKAAMFTDMATTQVTENDITYLVLTFANSCYWGSDPSAPHSSGGAYLDVCGYFTLNAKLGDTLLGSIPVKIVPYDDFNTMDEVYAELDEMEVFAAENTDLFVKQYSMGKSSGVIYEAMDMPYLIIADDESSVVEWLKFTEKAETNPTAVLADIAAGKYDDIKVPVMYSNIHANEVAATDGIMNFTWMLLESAAADGKMTYSDLTAFTAEGEAQLVAELANDGVVVPDLVKNTATYLGYLKAGNRNSGVVDLEKYYSVDEITVDIDALLDDVFFILVPEENVEGREYITRTASNGYDLNRDNSFQTTPETQNMQKLIGMFNPVSLMEFHGRVTSFQIEPCSPPHEPNFEYDLLSEHMMYAGEAFGTAAVASNDGYNSYVTPMRDYLYSNGDGTASWEPWDDMSTSYTPQFAMLQGSLAYTVELPAYNDDTVAAVQYGCLGLSSYLAENKLSVLTSQTKIFERGVTNANSDAYELVGQWLADQNDTEGAEISLFRPEFDGEGENGNFYPEFYIIPLDAENQTNLDAAYDMMAWLSRNDVKILITEKEYTYDGITYPAGTMIISMYQAKRSVANGALYDGTFITGWSDLYSEGITTFNETRGFDMVTVAKTGEISKINAACGDFMDYADSLDYIDANKKTQFSGVKYADVIISNASEASTSAVNALLKAGKDVGMITDEGSEFYGDFICSYKDYLTVADKYTLTATGIASTAENYPAAKSIAKAPTVYITGASSKNSSGFVYTSQVGNANWNYDRVAMSLMNFATTSDPAAADAIVGASSLNDAALAAVLSGTPYIGYGSTASSTSINANNPSRNGNLAKILTGAARVSLGGMDCMPFVTYGEKNLINGSYILDEDNVMYGYGNGFFSAIPVGAEILMQVDGSKEPTEGFLPITSRNEANVESFFDGGILGFAYQGKAQDGVSDINVAIFANSLTNKGHQRDEYAYISNFIFSSLLGEDYVPTYLITEGNEGVWNYNTPADLSFTSNGPKDQFTGVMVDGELVDAANYTVAEDAMTVTLKSDYINSLKNGEKAITLVFTDGEADGVFTVIHKAPATGDSFNAALWICLMSVTALAGAMIVCSKKQHA